MLKVTRHMKIKISLCRTWKYMNHIMGVDSIKFLNFDTRKLCGYQPENQTKITNLLVFCQNDANGIANSEDPDQTAPLGAV